jgi:hypothetical protein
VLRELQTAHFWSDTTKRPILLTPWQRALLLCSRQSGKSTVSAALGLHTALYQPESLTLLLAPAQRQSKELFGKLWGFYRAMGAPLPVKTKSALRVTFGNGSRIISLPGTEKTIRGFSGVDCLVIDEAARVEDGLYEAVRPMLAVSDGRLVALTTPFGRRGWFYEAWTDQEQDWQRVKVTANDCPRISEDFLQQERRELGRIQFEQEYMCQFHDSETAFFSTPDIDAAGRDDLAPLFGEGAPLDAGSDDIQPLTL